MNHGDIYYTQHIQYITRSHFERNGDNGFVIYDLIGFHVGGSLSRSLVRSSLISRFSIFLVHLTNSP